MVGSDTAGILLLAPHDPSLPPSLTPSRDGIVNLDYISLFSETREGAECFKAAVNALTFNMLHAYAAPCVFFYKRYVCTGLQADVVVT